MKDLIYIHSYLKKEDSRKIPTGWGKYVKQSFT